jgi:hypothetical protein
MLGVREQHVLRRMLLQVPDSSHGAGAEKGTAYLNTPCDPACPPEASRWLDLSKEWRQIKNDIQFDMVTKYAHERIQVAYIAGTLTSFLKDVR